MALDKITVDRINLLHPSVRKQVLDMYTHANEKLLGKYVRLRFSHTLRTIHEQNDLYALGRTKPGNIVTNAKGGQSFHNFGLAFDIVLLYDKDKNGTFETASWELNNDFLAVVQYFKNCGWFWGGNFKSFKDYPHFEMTLGNKTLTLLNNIHNGNVINEGANKYPILIN